MKSQPRFGPFRIASLLATLFGVVALTVAASAADLSHKAPSPSSKGKAGAAGAKASGGDQKAFDDVVKDMEVHEGLFTLYTKADDNTTLMEIAPDQIDATFLLSASTDQSVGERGFYAAQQLGEFPFVFHKEGQTIRWVMKNTLYLTDPDTPEARTAKRSFADAILSSAKIKSKPHPERKSILVDVSDLFGGDLPGFAPRLTRVYQPTNYRYDKEASGLVGSKTFPENTLFSMRLHYTTDNPRTFSSTLPDPRSVPIVVEYDLSPLKETGYQPRVADDRVGHFFTMQQDFRNDDLPSPYVYNISRWQLEKADSTAALSVPKQPIVYWLENTIPVKYRDWITEGILLWNKAFERVGFKDAIVVKVQPDTATWDPADSRYSTIRWFDGVDATFAIGPSRVNPYTGQIYDADIGISEGIVRYYNRWSDEFGDAASQPKGLDLDETMWMGNAWGRSLSTFCNYAEGLAEQAAFGMSVLEARGELTPETKEKLMHQQVVELVAHEVGHTLGLRHNFRASTMLPTEALYDVGQTSRLGQSGSVMDYNPIVLAPEGTPQGDYVTTTLGPYDYWAIEYAYKPFDKGQDEKAELARIASRSASDTLLTYATDEDAMGTYSPISIDPDANQFDASREPIEYFRERLGIVKELMNDMDKRLERDGDGYQVLRRTVGRCMREYNRSILTTSKLIGGIHYSRDHVGDVGGMQPFTPVPAAQQRDALAFLSEFAFGADAFKLPPRLQNRLALDKFPGFNFPAYFGIRRQDYPWHDAVLAVQSNVLDRIYDPVTLARIQDNEMRFAPGQDTFRMIDVFSGLTSSIWSELSGGAHEIPSLRRNLQREHLRQLIRIVLRKSEGPANRQDALPPEDASTLARASLQRIDSMIGRALTAGTITDATSRFHLEETRARIKAALDAQMARTIN